MTEAAQRPIIDAGPGLNFMSINQERLLFAVLGRLSAPEAVASEVERKAKSDKRFEAAGRVWPKVSGSYIEILSDEATPELERVVTRISGLPLADRMRSRSNLGETMVVAHAVVAAEQGRDVIVLIDDQGGIDLATFEAHRLNRLRSSVAGVGSVTVATTVTVLERAAQRRLIADRGEMRTLYARLRRLDDGLVPIQSTCLLNAERWAEPQ